MCNYLCINTHTHTQFVVVSIGHKIALASLFILRPTDKIQFNMKPRMENYGSWDYYFAMFLHVFNSIFFFCIFKKKEKKED